MFQDPENLDRTLSSYRISALGQVASGSIDVAEDYVKHLEVFLPWLLANYRERSRWIHKEVVIGKEIEKLN